MSVRVSGFKFAALSERMRGNIARELNSGVDSGVSLAKQLAAVDTGEMRDKIQRTDEATPDSLRAAYEAGADHSAFVEFGTINMEAQPFFTPAFESARRQVNNGLKRVLQYGGPRAL
jgi:HK97 gp10 family phage protein